MIQINTIKAAQKTIKNKVMRTPLVPAFSLSNEQREVRIKLETTQAIGAFKLRGAVNALQQLNPKQKQQGVVCASTGNHGRALAYAAQKLNIKATICMSSLVPQNKIAAIEKLGADVRIQGQCQDDAQALVAQLVESKQMIEIPPFDHEDIIAGQGTIGLEILEDWPEVDTLLIGLSGGGLLGGIALAVKSINPNIQVIGLSPKRGAAMAASLANGIETEVEELPTLADSLGGGIGNPNRYTFKLVQRYMDDLLLLSETQIKDAMQHLFFKESLVVEGAGAVGVAALIDQNLAQQLKQPLGKNIAIIASGRNVDMDKYLTLMGESKN